MIRKKGEKWIVYDSTGEKVLGEHDSEEDAKEQMRAIEARKHARVNVRVQVNAKAIRREMHNGREHIVVPSFTLPDGIVMNGGKYPKEEIDKSYAGLEGTLAPLGHPQIDGQYVSAREPEAINAYHVGAFNRNVKREGNRVAIEKWLDVEYAKNSESGRKVLEAIDKGEPIHTSTGIFLEREMTPNADGYDWIARNMIFDHDCILLNQQGAATPADGVGMLVNRQLVINSEIPDMQTNEDALKDSYGEKRDKLNYVIKERYYTEDSYAFAEDFDEESVVVCTPVRMFKVRYSLVDGNPVLGEEVGDVVVKTEFEMKTNRLKDWFKSLVQWNSKQTEPIPAITTEEPSEMTNEELQAALDAQAAKLQGAFNDALAALKADNEKELAAVNAKLQANADAAVAEKRKVVADKLGEVIANSLQGEALEDAFARCSVAAPIVGGFQGNQGADDQWKEYSLNAQLEAK